MNPVTLARLKSRAKTEKVSLNTLVDNILTETVKDMKSEEEILAEKKRTEEFLNACWGVWEGPEYDDVEDMIVNHKHSKWRHHRHDKEEKQSCLGISTVCRSIPQALSYLFEKRPKNPIFADLFKTDFPTPLLLSILYVVIAGIALPVGGIQMQYLWRNQLGDVYSLGLGSAACLGAATATMTGWCTLSIGSFIATLLCTLICFLVTLKLDTQKLITFGILFGTFIGSLGTIVVTNAPTGELLKKYYLWGAANFNMCDVGTGDIVFSLILFAAGFASALLSARPLTAHFRGETELSPLSKACRLLSIMFLVTSAVSICGPIGFISLGVPNLSRLVCKSADIRKHYIVCSAMGTGLLAVTYLVVKFVNFGIYLPISATMAIIALPLMLILFINPSK